MVCMYMCIYLADDHPLVVSENVRNLPGVEHVVDVLHEGLVDDLGVRKQERHRRAASRPETPREERVHSKVRFCREREACLTTGDGGRGVTVASQRVDVLSAGRMMIYRRQLILFCASTQRFARNGGHILWGRFISLATLLPFAAPDGILPPYL